MKAYFDIIISLLTLLTLGCGLYFVIRRFGLKRERFASLKIAIDTRVIHVSGEAQLVSVIIRLENKRETRISARRRGRADGFLYNERGGWDQCVHAGTLKIRAVPIEKEPLLFDWYSLKPMSARILHASGEGTKATEEDLEQINYLAEFQDPVENYKEVDFWLEPKESYDLLVPIWLRPGIYAAKALFLGPMTKHQEADYWSHTMLFQVNSGVPPNQSLQLTR